MTKPFLLLLAIIMMSFTFAHAQDMEGEKTDDSGFYIGASLLGTSFQLEVPGLGGETDTGGGIALEAGYNFNTNFAVFLSLDGSNMSSEDGEDYNFVHFDLGVEGRLGNYNSNFRPFARASLLGAAATIEDEELEAEISGSGFGLGAGFHYFLNRSFAFKVGYTYSWININEVKFESISVEVDEKGNSGRLGLGFSYHF